MPTAVVLTETPDPDDAIKAIWGENITEQMEVLGGSGAGITNKWVVGQLKARGLDVSAQAVGQWRSGQVAPRPHMMVALAAVLRVPPRMLFSLDVIRVAA